MVNMVPQTVFGRPLHMQAHDACQQQMYAQAAYGQQTQSPYGQPLYYAPPMTPAPAAGSNSLARSDQSFMLSPAPVIPAQQQPTAAGKQTQSPYGQPLYFPENADIVDLVLHAPQQAPAQGERQHARARAHTHTHTHTHVVAEETLYMRGITDLNPQL